MGFPAVHHRRVHEYQEDGPDYIHAILNGYTDPPAGFTLPPGAQYNKYFPGDAIGMPKPLTDGQVEYTDGTPTTVDQYGRDVAAFLMWAAEPTLDARKRLGFQVMIFLIVLTGLAVLHQEKSLARRASSRGDGIASRRLDVGAELDSSQNYPRRRNDLASILRGKFPGAFEDQVVRQRE